MSIRGFLREIEKGLKSPAYLLYSESRYLLKEAELALKRSIPTTERDFLFYTFDMKEPESSIEEIVDILHIVPFFRGRKIVVLEDAQRLSEKKIDVVRQYILKPSEDSILIMLFMDNEKGELKKSHKGMFKSTISITLDMKKPELSTWIRERASLMGLIISNDEIDYLMEVIGTDAGLLAGEIEKLAIAKTDDMKGLVSGRGDYSVFNLAEAVVKKDAQKVFKIYRALEDTIRPESILGAINWHFNNKADKDPAFLKRVSEILNEADIRVKSSFYPLEYALIRLLQL